MHTDADTSFQIPSSLSVVNLDVAPGEFQSSKITHAIHQTINDRLRSGRCFYAIEVSPHMAISNNESLDFNHFQRRIGLPLFTSITWMALANILIEPISDAPSMNLARDIRTGPVLSHLTCGNLTYDRLEQILTEPSLNNLLVLRGDFVSSTQPMQYAIQLVREIKRRRPLMSVAVGAYPEVHPDAESSFTDLQHLVDKVAAGADFVITQVCFSHTSITEFTVKCRSAGITVPIVVGVFVPATFRSLVAMCRVCRVRVPEDMFAEFRRLKNEPKEFREYSIRQTRALIRAVIKSNGATGFQFFTLNRFDTVIDCLDGLQLDNANQH